jgi:hypothetical protein
MVSSGVTCAKAIDEAAAERAVSVAMLAVTTDLNLTFSIKSSDHILHEVIDSATEAAQAF